MIAAINCRHCGGELANRDCRAFEFCSRACAVRFTTKRRGEVRAVADGWRAVLQWRLAGRECDQCGRWFSAPPNRKRCSGECKRAAYNEKARLCAIRRVSKSHGGRGMVAGYWSAVSRIEVFERDNWTCYICGGQCLRQWSDGRKEPLAPAIDHVVPVSKGGSHAMDNVRCIHRICNAAKKDRSEDETKRGVALAVWLAGVDVVDMYQ